MKRLLFLFLLLPTVANAQVTFDANATASVNGNAVTSITSSNLTVGSGSNRALVTQLSFSLKTVSSVTVTWDNGASNQAMASIVTANTSGTNGRADLWGLVNPISGAKQLRAAWTGSSDVTMNQTSFTGVNQTGGATTFPNSTSATGNSTTASVTITSATNDATMDDVVIANGTSTLSAPTQTQTYLNNNPANISGGGSRAAGAATVTHQWTLSGSGETWASVGTSIKAAGGGTPGCKNGLLMSHAGCH